MYYANLFQKNVVSNIELQAFSIASSLDKSLVSITSDSLIVKNNNEERLNIKLTFYEKEIFTITYLGRFENGSEFRLIQPIGISLEMAKKRFNAVGAFTIGTISTDGWALNFFLTEKNDLRNTDLTEKDKREHIQKLIQGLMMSLYAGEDKFYEVSKRILPLIKNNPSQLKDYKDSETLIDFYVENACCLDSIFDNDEKKIIWKILS